MRRDAESLAGDGFWYLATPYSKWAAGIDDAALMAARIAGSLARYHVAVFSPIAHSHAVAMASGIDPCDHTIWIPLDDPFMDAARGLIVADIDGWRDSYGVKVEIDRFLAMRKPRFLLAPDAMLVEPLA